jgi:myo-inositol-1(or 4)-monophosphatase
MNNPRDLLPTAIAVARAAGELIRNPGKSARTPATTKSSATDFATHMDLASERLITSMLAARRPADGVFGEEGAARESRSGLTWVVDPIDGTVNYVYGLPWYSVSVAVVSGGVSPADWQVLAGCVYAPELAQIWWAGAGMGAFRCGKRINLGGSTQAADAGPPLAGTGFGYRAEAREVQTNTFRETMPLLRDIRRMGSAAIDLALVAEGCLDAYFESGVQPWDMAAGQLLVEEAGGVVQGLGGGPASAAMTIAGPAQTVAKLAERIAAAGR